MSMFVTVLIRALILIHFGSDKFFYVSLCGIILLSNITIKTIESFLNQSVYGLK